jgi:3-deoxy-D-manno-octulosonic-acid transferase
VVFGTEYDKFMEAVELIAAGGAFSVESALELETLFENLLQDVNLREASCSAAKNYVYNKRGATQKILNYITANRLLTN